MTSCPRILIAALATGMAAASSQAATLTTSATAPDAGSAIAANTITGTFTRAFSDGPSGVGYDQTRGMSFTTGGTSGDIFSAASVTVLKNGTQTFQAGSSLTIWVGEYVAGGGDPGWNAGDGHADGDPFDGTNLNALVSGQTVSIAGQTLSGGDYLTIEFDAPISLTGDSEYFFLIGFQGLDSGNNDRLQLERGDGYADGQIVFTSDTGNSTLTQDMTFYINAVPEPGSLALIALGGLMIGTRRCRD